MHFAFTVTEDSFDEISEKFKGGMYFTRGPYGEKGKGRALFFIDPDGNEAEINTQSDKTEEKPLFQQDVVPVDVSSGTGDKALQGSKHRTLQDQVDQPDSCQHHQAAQGTGANIGLEVRHSGQDEMVLKPIDHFGFLIIA